MLADLHIHTTASDGLHKPEEVVRMAAQAGLKGISITDHDGVKGFTAAAREALKYGLDVIEGVEMSTQHAGDDIHILAYGIDPKSEPLMQHLAAFNAARSARAEKILTKLHQLGIDITYEQVLEYSGDGAITRPHIAQALLAQGKVGSVSEAFGRYLAPGKPAYVPRWKCEPVAMVSKIRSLGGVPVLAHPGISCEDSLIKTLLEAGLQGLEVYHPEHTRAASKHYLGLCRQYKLLPTGGSDFHGEKSAWHGQLGDVTVPYAVIKRLRLLAATNRQHYFA